MTRVLRSVRSEVERWLPGVLLAVLGISAAGPATAATIVTTVDVTWTARVSDQFPGSIQGIGAGLVSGTLATGVDVSAFDGVGGNLTIPAGSTPNLLLSPVSSVFSSGFPNQAWYEPSTTNPSLINYYGAPGTAHNPFDGIQQPQLIDFGDLGGFDLVVPIDVSNAAAYGGQLSTSRATATGLLGGAGSAVVFQASPGCDPSAPSVFCQIWIYEGVQSQQGPLDLAVLDYQSGAGLTARSIGVISYSFAVTQTVIPEPASTALFAVGMLVAAMAVRRRRA